MRLILLLWCILLYALPSQAASVTITEFSEARLVSNLSQVSPGDNFWAGLHIKLQPHWHSYWQNPGDSGAATTITWNAQEGITTGPIHWPAPQRIPYGDLVNFGYDNEVMLLVPINVAKDFSGTEFTLTAQVQWLVCNDICVPEEATFSLTLPISHESTPSAEAPLVEQWQATLPVLFADSVNFSFSDSLQFTFTLPNGNSGITSASYFPLRAGITSNNAEPSSVISNTDITFTLPATSAPADINGIVTITSADGVKAYQLQNTSSTASSITTPAPLPTPEATTTLPLALLLALLGGIILNIMPCVFPVLSLKALAIAREAHMPRKAVQMQGIAYTLGVLACFATLAGILLLLREAGQQIGWGFQMQSPLFVALMAYILFALGLSLSGFFHLPVLFGNGQLGAPNAKNSFVTGLLAALVATPCTAPFMGTALGFALTQPSAIAISVFLALGFGMALPFLLISFFPALHRLMPKPGLWMQHLKEFLAFPLYVSVAWLLWVLAQQTGPHSFAVVIAGILLIAFCVWLWRVLPQRRSTALILFLLCLTPFIWIRGLPPQQAAACAAPDAISNAFSNEKLAALRATGTPVLVNATAAWCITCQVNERLALGTDEFKILLETKGISYLVADWTSRDETITHYLSSFGRSGVPLYVYYPTEGDPVILPQLLTMGTIKDYLR